MITAQCQAIIDEAITAGGDLSKLSAEAVAHLETCIECRRSLESIKALKASTTSVIPIAASSLALKGKIATKLEGAMQARRAAIASTAAKSSIGAGSILLGLGLCGAITCGVVFLSNNKNYSKVDSSGNYQRESTIAQKVSSTNIKNSDESGVNENINNIATYSELGVSETDCNEDMRNYEPIRTETQRVPSVNRDSD